MNTEQIRGNRVLAGAWGKLYVDGELLAECKSINASVEIQRADIQVGLDIDSKMTGVKGEGTFVLDHVYTRGLNRIQENIKKGIDNRLVLSSRITDPDAIGGQHETVNMGNVWVNKYDLANWAKAEAIEKEYGFGFTPTDADIAEGVY
ncbi:MAG: phage tail tube protein [Tissierellia bacterium]|nr:phage tail tube protein [Tissierellia bacterium]